MVSTFDGVSVKCWLVKIHDSNSYTVPNRFAAGDGRFFFRTCHPSVLLIHMVPLCLLPLPFRLLIMKLWHLAYMHSAKRSDQIQILQFKLYKLDSSQVDSTGRKQ